MRDKEKKKTTTHESAARLQFTLTFMIFSLIILSFHQTIPMLPTELYPLNRHLNVLGFTFPISWHCGVIFIGMLVLNAAMACFYHRRRGNRSLQTFPKRTPMIPGTEPGVQSQNGTKYSILSTDDDDGNDDTKEERRDFEI